MSLFKQIDPVRAYQVVSAQLEEIIVSGKLSPGDRLPPERQLIQELGTSRRTLREAFRVLEQKGLIEIKIGAKGGAFVTDRIGERMSEFFAILIRRQNVTQTELAEFRANTEGAVAGLAAQRADPSDVQHITTHLAEMETLLRHDTIDIDDFVGKEINLHHLLAKACKNAVYENIVKTIHAILLYPMFRQDAIDHAYIQRAVDDWKKLLHAIENQDARASRRIMQQHIHVFDEMAVNNK